MQKLPFTALRDTGRVRFGAGMRAPAAQGAGRMPERSAAVAPATDRAAMMLPRAAVADAGRVRFGAGMRRG